MEQPFHRTKISNKNSTSDRQSWLAAVKCSAKPIYIWLCNMQQLFNRFQTHESHQYSNNERKQRL